MAGLHGRLGPPQQIRARSHGPLPQREPGEPAVRQHQHSRCQSVNQLASERVLRCRVRAQLGIDDGVAPTLAQSHQPGLGERCTLALVHARPTEPLVVLDGVGHVETGAIDRHQPPARQPCPRRPRRRQRPGDPPEQRLDWRRAQPDAGLEDGRLRRQLHRLRLRGPRQAIGQQRQDVLVRALRMQRHPDREIHHHPSRQRPMTLLPPARLRDHLIHQLRRKRARQHSHRHEIRQPTIRLRLDPSSARHPNKLHQCSPN
jgi:hypothetical protein